MKNKLLIIFISTLVLLFSACDSMESIHDNNISSPDVPVEPDITIISDTNVSSSNTQTDSIVSDVVFGQVKTKIPTLVVIMNWQNITENDLSVWYNKIFNLEANSVDRWYYDATDANIEFVPIHETSGTTDDGVITVNMGVNHPGSDSGHEVQFRDTYLGKAMHDVDANVDFSKYDVNHDGSVSQKELQVIFIIAGGEESYNQIARNAIWAHAWSFDESNPLILDGVKVISDTGDTTNDGWYARFGAVQYSAYNKLNNNESGTQTSAHHYQVRLIERDTRDSLTSNTGITAEYSDAYTDGEIASSSKVRSYDGNTSYSIKCKQVLV